MKTLYSKSVHTQFTMIYTIHIHCTGSFVIILLYSKKIYIQRRYAKYLLSITPRTRYWENSMNNHVKGVDVEVIIK